MVETAEAPVRQAQTEGVYDRSVSPVVNARDDARAIEADVTRGNADQALTRFQQETSDRGLQGATLQQQTDYRASLTDQLTRDGVLPVLSIAAIQQEGDRVKTNGAVDLAKVNARATELQTTDPLKAMLLTGYAREQEAMRRPGSGLIPDGLLRTQLDRNVDAARGLVKDNQVRESVSPLADPKLFDAMAGMGRGVRDGRIEQRDLDAFRTQWNDSTDPGKQAAFRAQFGTREQQERIDKFLQATPKVDSSDMRRLGISENNWWSNNAITKDTLTAGLGGPEALQRAQDGLRAASDGTLRSLPEAARDLEATKIRPNDGPYQVSKRMLEGADLADPAKAQRDLQAAITGVFDHKQGSSVLEGAKRDQVRESIRQGGNTELLNWFDSRYPKSADATAPADAPLPGSQEAKNAQLRSNTSPLADPKLFDAMAGMGRGVRDGRIEQKDLDAFRAQWGDGTTPPTQAQTEFRNRFGTQEQQARIDKFLKDTPTVDTPDARRLGIIESNGLLGNPNAFTKETLTRGLGGPEATQGLLNELRRGPDGRVHALPEPAASLDSTKIGRNEGPYQVSQRMLQGADLADPVKAQRDLQTAIGPVFDHKQGSSVLEGAKRDQVRESIRQGGNTELLNWFDSRYPKSADAAAPADAPLPGSPAAKDKQLRSDTAPLADPNLFDAMAGLGRGGIKDGRIEQKDLDAFRAQWGDGTAPLTQAQTDFRNRFGTQEQQARIDKFLKDTPTVDTPDARRLGLIERNTWSPNAFTKETLTAGLGGPEAIQSLRDQMRLGTDGRVHALPDAAADHSAATIGRNEGPWHVSRRMLQGADLADPVKAQKDLQAALGSVYDGRQGSDLLKDERLDKVREAIRSGGNTELLNWFDKRYPKPKK